jgi:hypothetical protein
LAFTEDSNVTYVCDSQGNKISVVVNIERYKKLLEFERIVRNFYTEINESSHDSLQNEGEKISDLKNFLPEFNAASGLNVREAESGLADNPVQEKIITGENNDLPEQAKILSNKKSDKIMSPHGMQGSSLQEGQSFEKSQTAVINANVSENDGSAPDGQHFTNSEVKQKTGENSLIKIKKKDEENKHQPKVKDHSADSKKQKNTASEISDFATKNNYDELKLIKEYNLESVIVDSVPHIKYKYTTNKASSKNYFEAYGYFATAGSKKGFVIMKGSCINKTHAESVRLTVKKERERLVREGIVYESGDSLCFSSSVVYNSPSLAASVVAGSNRSGFEAWKASNGQIMKQFIQVPGELDA